MALNLTPPNVQTTIADKMGNMVHTWARWFQQLYTVLSNLDALVTTINTSLTTHIADTSPHSATSAATPDRLVLRDGAGRTKMVAPSASDDVAIKSTVDTVQTNLTNHEAATSVHGATVTATADRIILRSATGTAQVSAPSATADIARKLDVDAVQTNLNTHTALANAHTLPTPVANNYIKRNAGNTAYDAVTITTIRDDLLTVDGSGSGLDADLLDGFSSSQTTTPSTVAVRNSSGNLLVANAVNSNHAVAFGQEASASATGLITTGTQTIAGTKTFNSNTITFPAGAGGIRHHKVTGLADNATYTHNQVITSGILLIRSSGHASALYLIDFTAANSIELADPEGKWQKGDPGDTAGDNGFGLIFADGVAFQVINRTGASRDLFMTIMIASGTP